MSRYRLGMACLNGHPVNSSADEFLELNSKHCGECGAATITNCQSCQAKIRGFYDAPGVISIHPWLPDSYCYECGNPYPWTQTALEVAGELIDESDNLGDNEKEQFKNALADLTTDTARTELSVQRYKKFAEKAGVSVAEGVGKILVSVLSEAAKRGLGF